MLLKPGKLMTEEWEIMTSTRSAPNSPRAKRAVHSADEVGDIQTKNDVTVTSQQGVAVQRGARKSLSIHSVALDGESLKPAATRTWASRSPASSNALSKA